MQQPIHGWVYGEHHSALHTGRQVCAQVCSIPAIIYAINLCYFLLSFLPSFLLSFFLSTHTNRINYTHSFTAPPVDLFTPNRISRFRDLRLFLSFSFPSFFFFFSHGCFGSPLAPSRFLTLSQECDEARRVRCCDLFKPPHVGIHTQLRVPPQPPDH